MSLLSTAPVSLLLRPFQADCTVDKKQGQKYGRAVLDFDGIHPLPTAEGPILKERGNLPDMPEAVVNRHRQAATIFLHYMESNENFPELPANIVEGETMDVVLNPPEGWKLLAFFNGRRFGGRKIGEIRKKELLRPEGPVLIRLNEGIFIAESKSHDHLKNLKPLQETLAEQGIRVTNTLIEHETTYPAKIWRKELNLPDEVQVIRIRRLKKIGEEILAFEKKNLPLEIAEKFPSEKIPTEPFLSLLSQYPETEIYRIVYRKYVSHLLENYAEMMGLQEDSPILVRSGVYYNRLNLPIKAGRMIYPADKVELHFEVRKNERNPERLMLFKA